MALSENDLKIFKQVIVDSIQENNIRLAQIFPTKIEIEEIINGKLDEELTPIRVQLSETRDMVASILSRLDHDQLPVIERQVIENTDNIRVLQKEVGYLKQRK
jgi:hypothetical protein